MAKFCKPFMTAKIRYFETFEIDDARRWITLEPGNQLTAMDATHGRAQ